MRLVRRKATIPSVTINVKLVSRKWFLRSLNWHLFTLFLFSLPLSSYLKWTFQLVWLFVAMSKWMWQKWMKFHWKYVRCQTCRSTANKQLFIIIVHHRVFFLSSMMIRRNCMILMVCTFDWQSGWMSMDCSGMGWWMLGQNTYICRHDDLSELKLGNWKLLKFMGRRSYPPKSN